MTNLEITRACAEAMGLERLAVNGAEVVIGMTPNRYVYRPLHDDAQAMALVKRFGLVCDPQHDGQDFASDPGWEVSHPSTGDELFISPDLNCAICLCVLKMHTGKA